MFSSYSTSHVLQLFVHRVGRAARAGRNGAAYSFVTATELPYVVDLGLFLGKKLPYLGLFQLCSSF
jgi:ATP-dependent RNA helicase DDX54/DBP10